MSWKQDLYSKLMDGVLPGFFLFLLMVTIALLQAPIRSIIGRPGILVYAIVLVSITIYSLEHAILSRFTDVPRLLWGMVGGILAWTVTAMANRTGSMGMTGEMGFILFILFGLIVVTLWRHVLPLGVRYFMLAFLMNWAAQLLLHGQPDLTTYSAVFVVLRLISGYTALLAALGIVVWLFFRSQDRLQRIKVSLWFYFCLAVGLSAFLPAVF